MFRKHVINRMNGIRNLKKIQLIINELNKNNITYLKDSKQIVIDFDKINNDILININNIITSTVNPPYDFNKYINKQYNTKNIKYNNYRQLQVKKYTKQNSDIYNNILKLLNSY